MFDPRLVAVVFVVVAGVAWWYFRKITKGNPDNQFDRDRAWEEMQAQAEKNLSGRKFAVLVRQPNGKQTSLETLVIEGLLNKGAQVFSLAPEVVQEVLSGKYEALPEGFLLCAGVGWEIKDTVKCHLDLSIVDATGRILSARSNHGDCTVLVSISLVPCLASRMQL